MYHLFSQVLLYHSSECLHNFVGVRNINLTYSSCKSHTNACGALFIVHNWIVLASGSAEDIKDGVEESLNRLQCLFYDLFELTNIVCIVIS